MKIAKAYVVCIVLTCYITILLTFASAYLNGMQTLVTINDYGEANIEALMLGVSLILLLLWVKDVIIIGAEQ